MKFITTPGPFQRQKRTTLQIMLELSAALILVWIAGIVYNFVVNGAAYGVKAIVMVLVSLVATLLADILVAAIRHKESDGPIFNHILKQVVHNYSYVTALIFVLTLPIGVPYYVIIIGSLFATLVVKYAFGGFGSNVFNPAAMARILVGVSFSGSMVSYLGGDIASVPTLDLVSGATITTQFAGLGTKWLTDSLTGLAGNVTMLDLFLGNYAGALGETFTFLILALAVVLSIRKVINWRTPAFYLGTVAITSVIIALFTGLNPLDYTLISLGMGGLAFGAVFMLTDPVSSPTSPFGKALIGVIAGFITVLIRVQGNLPEGVIYSIAIVNMVAPVIDKLATGLTNANSLKKWGVVVSMAVVSLAVNGGISAINLRNANSSSESSESGTTSESSESSEGSSSSEPVITPFKTLSGSASSSACEDYCSVQTMTVSIDLDEQYDILDITIAEAPTTGGNYATLWGEGFETLVDYYQGIGIVGIQAMTPANASALPAGSFTTGVTESSFRLFNALKDAVSDVEVYFGNATSTACDDYCDPQTLDVTVYVEAGVISTLKVSGGITTTSGPYASTWAESYPDVLAYYQGMTVAEFQALAAPAADGLVAGVTVTSDRLFVAIQHALSSYGG